MSTRVIDWSSPQMRGAVIGSVVLGVIGLIVGTILVVRSVRGSSTEVQGWKPTGTSSAPAGSVGPTVLRPGWDVRNPGNPGSGRTGPTAVAGTAGTSGAVGNPGSAIDKRPVLRVDSPGNPRPVDTGGNTLPAAGSGAVGNPGGGSMRTPSPTNVAVGNPSATKTGPAFRSTDGSPVGNTPMGSGREPVAVNGQTTVANPGSVRITKGPQPKVDNAFPGNRNPGNPSNPGSTVRKTNNSQVKGAGNPGNSRGGR